VLLFLMGCAKSDDAPAKISVVPDTVVELPKPPVPIVPSDTSAPPVLSSQPGDSSPHGLLIPVAGVKWSELRDSFHEMRGTRTHNALDIMAARGTPVLSTDNGTLLKMHNSVPGGLTLYAADPTKHFIYLYGHLDSYNPSLREGQSISRGDTLGFVGSTGNAAAAGPHLHFAVVIQADLSKWWQGTPIDPRPLLH
jgi:murein DD-endopeptidase MepM/ murein hydrolase activator NlpD